MYVPVLGNVSDILLGVFLLILLLYWHVNRNLDVWERLGVPGPKPWPVLYHIPELRAGMGACLEKWEKEYGRSYGLYNFQTKSATLVTTDVNILNNVLVKDFSSFVDREYMETTTSSVVDGLFFQNGDTWKRNRHVLSPMFTGGKMRLMLPHIDDSASNLAQLFLDTHSKGQLIPVKLFAARYTSDVIAKTGFGLDVEAVTKEDSEFFHHIENFFQMGKLGFRVFRYLAFYFPKLMKIGSRLSSNVDPIVPEVENYFVSLAETSMNEKKKMKQKQGASSSKAVDMMDLMLEAEVTDDRKLTCNDHALTKKDIIGNSSILILAGFETTSSLLQALFYFLACYPDIQDKVIAEVDTVMAGRLKVEYDLLPKLVYTEQVINESLRSFPPSPSIARRCSETKTYGNITIPAGANVFIPIYKILRDPEYWPEPEKFDPDRFSAENKANHDPVAFLAFGFGPRQCVGKRLALMEVKVALCHILSRMKFVLNERTEPKEGQDVKQNHFFGFLIPEKPIHVDIVPRKA
ncbi:cytochrome P450 3A56 [Aplysia californica]|uniref:Cytochrome P450 3A56 n=1 Tax=Aplysia californica TaxID=6500 RepID=A0ABM0ZXH3_APLCA|nr:cytochrome P450 3A56 [Aplysia californica]